MRGKGETEEGGQIEERKEIADSPIRRFIFLVEGRKR
jgi:hypothetical protein